VVLVPGVDPAAGGAEDHARLGAEHLGELEARARDGLARREHGELREPVVECRLLAVEILFGRPSAHLRANPDRQPVQIRDVKLADTARPLAHGGAGRGHVLPQCVDGAGAGNGDAPHARPCSATRRSTAAAIDSTVEMSKVLWSGAFALNGTVISNASSMANIASTSPRLSTPRSAS